MKNVLKIVLVLLLTVVTVSYTSRRSQPATPPVTASITSDVQADAAPFDSIGADDSTYSDSTFNSDALASFPIEVRYYWMKSTDSLRKNLSGTKKDLVLAVNRISENRMRRLDSLIVPDTVTSDFLAYSPFPAQLDSASEVEKMIFFDYGIQAFAAYENGRLVRWGPVSMGAKGRLTPTGLYHTNYKKKRKISTVDSEWIMDWYFNIMNFEGIGMHEYSMPGYPASHGCLRLLEPDAVWLYDWAEQWRLTPNEGSVVAYGTPVFIYGAYDFDSPAPWHELVNNPQANNVPADSLNARVSKNLEKILKRQTVRDSVLVARSN